jgi:hypothetical protein
MACGSAAAHHRRLAASVSGDAGVHVRLAQQFSRVVAGLATLIISVALTVFLDYAVWGVSTRRFWAPDYETVLIVRTSGASLSRLRCFRRLWR